MMQIECLVYALQLGLLNGGHDKTKIACARNTNVTDPWKFDVTATA